MLVLSRKPGESIHIGDDIVVTVIRNGGNRIRLGISAPPDTPITRSELREQEPESTGCRRTGGIGEEIEVGA